MVKVEEFKNAKDADGNLLHPNFEALQDQMIKIRDAGLVDPNDFQGMYEKAELLNPTTRAKKNVFKVAKAKSKKTISKTNSVGNVPTNKFANYDPKDPFDEEILSHFYDQAQAGRTLQ